MRPLIKWALVSLASLVGLVGVGGYLWFRPHVEEIPDVLPELDAQTDPLDLVIPAQADLPPLELRSLLGNTVYLVVFSRESAESGESKKLQRALDTWVFPEDTVGFGIGHVKGYGAFSGMIDEMMGAFRAEARLPIYADYEGVVMDTFRLPAGHFGLVILGPQGELVLRHSGDADATRIEEIQAALGAQPPPEPEAAPRFAFGEVTNERCAGTGCIFVFLDRPVAAADVPGLVDDGGRPSMRKAREAFEQLKQPSVRLVHRLAAYWKLDGSIPGAIVGKTQGIALEGFERLDDSPELRAYFDLPPDEAAMVIVDGQGRICFSETGFVPMYKFAGVRDLIELPEVDEDERGP